MDEILQWGIDIIIAIQRFRVPYLDSFFKILTSIGGDLFYFLMLSFLYWCVDAKESARFIVVFCLSYWLNSELKGLLNQPRPYFIEPGLKIGHCSGGGGFPSYHAQGSFLFWGYLALWNKKTLLYIFSAAIILLIAFSRVYLGLHFPTDILGGWILAILMLCIFIKFHGRIEAWLSGLNLSSKILIAFIIPVLMSLVNPSSWIISAMGTMGGFGVGYCIAYKYINFGDSAGFIQKLARYITGIVVLGIIHYGLRDILPGRGHSFFLIFVFIRFWFMGFWISAGAPWIFERLKLVKSDV